MSDEMSQVSSSSVLCPLCDEELNLDLPIHRVPAKWRDAFNQRDQCIEVAEQFRINQSIEVAAQSLSLTPTLAEYLLQFLCTEICGCRTVTCVSCLDDYRNVL